MRLPSARLAYCLAGITLTFFCISLYMTPSDSDGYRRFSPVYAPEKHAGTDDVKQEQTLSTADTGAPGLHPAQSNCATACSKADDNDNHSSKAVSDNVPSPANPASCLDEDRSCVTWEGQGECLTNPAFMLKACRQACGVCQPAVPVNHQARNC